MTTKNKSQDSSTRKDEQKNDSDSRFYSKYPDNNYPANAEEYLELSFPKGDKKRGYAMVILAIAFFEGQEKAKKKFEKMIEDLRMNKEWDSDAMLVLTELRHKLLGDKEQ